MKLMKWEKDLSKAVMGMYIAKNIEITNNELEYEITKLMNDFNGEHRELVKSFINTL